MEQKWFNRKSSFLLVAHYSLKLFSYSLLIAKLLVTCYKTCLILAAKSTRVTCCKSKFLQIDCKKLLVHITEFTAASFCNNI